MEDGVKQLKSKIILIALIGTSICSYGQNRDQSNDSVFKDPANAGLSQVLIGVTQLFAAAYIAPTELSAHQKAIRAAQLELEISNLLPLSEADRKEKLAYIRLTGRYYANEIDRGQVDKMFEQPRQIYERIKASPIFTDTQKTEAWNSAALRLAQARESGLKAAQQMGKLEKSIHIIRVGATVLLVGDVAARIGIWFAQDADPTISPATTYIHHLLK